MSTNFVRQFIKMFPTQYMEYINCISNFESDLESVLVESNKTDVTVKLTYQKNSIIVLMSKEMIKQIDIITPDGNTIAVDCSFRYNTFLNVLDTLLIMLLVKNPPKHSKK